MTRVDFYILPDGAEEGAAATAARLCDKAAAQGLRIYVNVPGGAPAAEVDSLLWTLRQGSFLAHEPWDGRPVEEPPPAILVGNIEPPASHHDVLVNLGAEVPAWFSRFERVAEIVAGTAEQRQASRERFKFYRDRGYELTSHKL